MTDRPRARGMHADSPLRLPDNQRIAQWLREAAELLRAQGANPFRVAAYRKAAETVSACTRSLRVLLATDGPAGLDALPGIGAAISAAIVEMLSTGRWAQLDRLRGELDPATLFRTVPGIGPELAERIHDRLGVETLEALEVAAHDGRLANVPGVGRRRAASICAVLAHMLDRSSLRASGRANAVVHWASEPGVATLLDVDGEYLRKAASGSLPTIAPRRFNPDREPWLPVLHTQRGDWHFTVLFSNTARAHDLGRTRDWVVIFFYDSDHVERQRTVVTERRGHLSGRRVVRGREAQCAAYYEHRRQAAEPGRQVLCDDIAI